MKNAGLDEAQAEIKIARRISVYIYIPIYQYISEYQ